MEGDDSERNDVFINFVPSLSSAHHSQQMADPFRWVWRLRLRHCGTAAAVIIVPSLSKSLSDRLANFAFHQFICAQQLLTCEIAQVATVSQSVSQPPQPFKMHAMRIWIVIHPQLFTFRQSNLEIYISFRQFEFFEISRQFSSPQSAIESRNNNFFFIELFQTSVIIGRSPAQAITKRFFFKYSSI